jgi:hypothetical protein
LYRLRREVPRLGDEYRCRDPGRLRSSTIHSEPTRTLRHELFTGAFHLHAYFQFPTGTLRKQAERDHWLLTNGSYTAAVGSSEQIDRLIEFLNKRVDSEPVHGRTLHAMEASLQKRFAAISDELDLAIASRRPHGRCDLV